MSINCGRCGNKIDNEKNLSVCWECWRKLRFYSAELKDKIRRRNIMIKDKDKKIAEWKTLAYRILESLNEFKSEDVKYFEEQFKKLV